MSRHQRTYHCSQRYLSTFSMYVAILACVPARASLFSTRKNHIRGALPPLKPQTGTYRCCYPIYWLSPVFISERSMEPSMPNSPPLLFQGHASFASRQYRCVRGNKLSNPLLKVSHSSPTAVTLLIVLQFMAQIPYADAVDLKACGARVQEQQNAARNTTNTTELPLELRISYEECLVECGAGMGSVNWQGFSQNFGAWLLPWITLMFQIPFGAERKSHTFVLYCT